MEKEELFNKWLWDNWKKDKIRTIPYIAQQDKFQMNQRSIYKQLNYKY